MTRSALLLAVLLVTACSRAPELDTLAAGETGRVARVTSGHALDLEGGQQVRLVGIVAPRGDEPYAWRSEDLLRHLAEGEEVKLSYGGRRRDNYERALAQVTLKKGGRWLQREMLRAGAARVRIYPDNRALAAALLEDEAAARNAGKGLWALAEYDVLLPGEASSAFGFVLVEGRPQQVTDVEGGARLEFGHGFRAYVPARALRDFTNARLAPATLKGRLLRVRGGLRDGELRLDVPEQVEILKGR